MTISKILTGALLAVTLLPGAGMPALDEAGYAKMVAAQKGKVVLVNFWATYCIPCRKEMPALVRLEAKLKARGFALITISADEPEQEQMAQAFLDKTGVGKPFYVKRAKDDDKFINTIDAKWSGALPASFLYDRNGRKVRTFIGEADLAVLEDAISKLL